MQDMHSTTAWKCFASAIKMYFWSAWDKSIAEASKRTVAGRAEHRITGRTNAAAAP